MPALPALPPPSWGSCGSISFYFIMAQMGKRSSSSLPENHAPTCPFKKCYLFQVSCSHPFLFHLVLLFKALSSLESFSFALKSAYCAWFDSLERCRFSSCRMVYMCAPCLQACICLKAWVSKVPPSLASVMEGHLYLHGVHTVFLFPFHV